MIDLQLMMKKAKAQKQTERNIKESPAHTHTHTHTVMHRGLKFISQQVKRKVSLAGRWWNIF